MDFKEIYVKSSLDGSDQPSMFYKAEGECRPLLVGLHTWSYDRRNQMDNLLPLAKKHGFSFCGTHPMAGLHFSGIDYSRAELFEGASMVLVPPSDADMALTDHVIELLAPAKFGRFTLCSAEEHDKMIAYTSQLAHVVSNAYVCYP